MILKLIFFHKKVQLSFLCYKISKTDYLNLEKNKELKYERKKRKICK